VKDTLYVAGDISGIQDYVLSVSTLGGGQARRLRARSFFVQVVEELAARAVHEELGAAGEEEVVFRGGGQFLVRLQVAVGAEEKLCRLRASLEAKLHRDTQGALGFTLAWGRSVGEALERKEREKRRPWASTTTREGSWQAGSFPLDPLVPRPCDVCGRRPTTQTLRDEGEEIGVCVRCYDDTEIGRRLPSADRLELCSSGGDFHVLARGLRFNTSTLASNCQVLHAPKLHVPADMTFKDIADRAQGDNLLGVLKADVDSMGAKLAEMRGDLGALKEFSRALDDFFSRQLQQKLETEPWSWIYTIYSGGDDLLLVGPWDLVLDFAEEVHRDFRWGPATQYGLTFSAGIALTNYRVPIRHAVERADELLELAKGRRPPESTVTNIKPCHLAAEPQENPKNHCAALGWAWKWERHTAILAEAKRLKAWIDQGICPRSMVHRLLSLADRQDPLRTAQWAYEVGRNFPKSNATSPEARALRAWGERVLAEILEDPGAARELAVQLRYALIASRPRREEP
jgi:CRISPR-associated protein Csm1